MLDLVISDFAKSNDFQIIHRDNFLSNLKQYHDLLKELDVNNLNFIERKSKKTTYYSFSILDSFYSQYPHEEFDLLIELVEK